MSVREAIDSILENRLADMKQHLSNALTTKAVERLEERKVVIGQNYFGQSVNEEEEQLDEISSKVVLKARNIASKKSKKAGKEGNWPAQKGYEDQAQRLQDRGLSKEYKERWNSGLKSVSSGKRAKSNLKPIKE